MILIFICCLFPSIILQFTRQEQSVAPLILNSEKQE